MSDREQQLQKLALKKKLEIFSFPSETIEQASGLENLQKALDWIFIHGNMGDLTPGKQAPPLPKESGAKSAQPPAPTPTAPVPISPAGTSKQSTIAQKIIQLENEGYSQEEIQTILKEEKLVKLSSSSSPSSSPSSVVPPANAPVLDLSNATDEDLAKLLQSQLDAEDAAVIAGNSPSGVGGGEANVQGTAEKRILNEKERAQKAREYQEKIRKEIQEREKKAERERERARREQGKDVLSQKEKYDQMVIKAQREQREREKNWEKNEMARVRKKIQEDKERRKKELEAQQREAQQKK